MNWLSVSVIQAGRHVFGGDWLHALSQVSLCHQTPLLHRRGAAGVYQNFPPALHLPVILLWPDIAALSSLLPPFQFFPGDKSRRALHRISNTSTSFFHSDGNSRFPSSPSSNKDTIKAGFAVRQIVRNHGEILSGKGKHSWQLVRRERFHTDFVFQDIEHFFFLLAGRILNDFIVLKWCYVCWPCSLLVDGVQFDHSPCARDTLFILRSMKRHGNVDPDSLHQLFDLFCNREFDCRHILTRITMLMHS